MATDGDELTTQIAEVVTADGDSGTEMQLLVMTRARSEQTTQECTGHQTVGRIAHRKWRDAIFALF